MNVSSFVYNGLGDRYQQIVNSATTTYQLDLAAGLVNVLADGENTYLYGNTVIAQVSDTQTGYYLPDVLGSVRQMTSPTGEVQLSQRFTPFGEVKEKYGDGKANFGYTGQKYDAQTGLLYLRARYYAPGMGRFISQDTWSGDANMPMSYNAWLYGYGNPIRYVDPSGMLSCNKNDSICIQKSNELLEMARNTQIQVTNGTLLPVKAFAGFIDLAYVLFDRDISDMVWGMTRVIVGFDPDRKTPIFYQAYDGMQHIPEQEWIGEDWLPYKSDTSITGWTQSYRGDWKKEYWDKTANQAFHFWFYTAVTFFDPLGAFVSDFADFYHDKPWEWEEIDDNEMTPPPQLGSSINDHLLAIQGRDFGILLKELDFYNFMIDSESICDDTTSSTVNFFFKPGNWILSRLSDTGIVQ